MAVVSAARHGNGGAPTQGHFLRVGREAGHLAIGRGIVMLLFLAVGCGEEILPPSDGGSWAVVAGEVVTETPVPGSSVQSGELSYNCETHQRISGSLGSASRGLIDASGGFVLPLFAFLGGPGVHCFELIVTPPGGATRDTFPDISAQFSEEPPGDTTWVVLTLP